MLSSHVRSAGARPGRAVALIAIFPLSLGLISPALASAPSSAASAASAPAASDARRAYAAAGWQGRQLDSDGAIPSGFGNYKDWGLTVDTALALAADGRHPKKLATVTSAVKKHYYADYATYQGTVSANAMSKTLVLAKSLHRNARDFGGHDLRRIVLNRMAGSGAGVEQGRLRDKTTTDLPTDYSNTFGQAYGVIGLARSGGVPMKAVSYLLRQRCSDGYFRIYPVVGETCDQSGSAADVDATALAVQALVTARDHGVSLPAGVLSGSVGWLVTVQKSNGSFGGGVGTEASNTNSTGLAAQALAATKRWTPASLARAWVRKLQITTYRAGKGPAAKDVGAIAYDKAALKDALANGLTSTSRGQFQRATPQAYFALDREPLGKLLAP